jgi:hypothetical protein
MVTAGLVPTTRLTWTAKRISALASVRNQAAHAQCWYNEERTDGNRNGYDSTHMIKRLASPAALVNADG